MPKCTLFTFSGTGNTRWAAEKLSEHLIQYNYTTRISDLEQQIDIREETDNSDVIGFAFPIHSSFAPQPVQNAIEQMPAVQDGKPLIALTTAGYVAGDVLWHALHPLRQKGYRPQVFCNIILGNNMHLPGLCPLPVTTPEKLRKRMEKADMKLKKMSRMITHGQTHLEGKNPGGRLLGALQRAIAGNLETLAFRGFHSDERCINCGWCIRHCPADNIIPQESGVRFLDNCLICMRCYSYCPKQAIQLTEKTGNLEKYKRYRGPSRL